jgi:hypothetical protein
MRLGTFPRITLAILALATVGLLGACAHEGHHHEGMGAEGGSAKIYWCGSATDGPCSGISTSPGTCPDGKPMNAGHVVWMEGSTALVCVCGADCTCKIDPNDRTKCGCGKPIRRIDLAGTGIYFCNCKGSCGCNMISDKPVNCRCGMPLHQQGK